MVKKTSIACSALPFASEEDLKLEGMMKMVLRAKALKLKACLGLSAFGLKT